MLTPAHIDLYCRIKSSPFRQAGYRVDDALIYCEMIEKRMAKLDETQRTILVLQGIGFTQGEIAKMANMSLRAIVRRNTDANRLLFAELIETLGTKAARRCGKTCQGARPRKVMA